MVILFVAILSVAIHSVATLSASSAIAESTASAAVSWATVVCTFPLNPESAQSLPARWCPPPPTPWALRVPFRPPPRCKRCSDPPKRASLGLECPDCPDCPEYLGPTMRRRPRSDSMCFRRVPSRATAACSGDGRHQTTPYNIRWQSTSSPSARPSPKWQSGWHSLWHHQTLWDHSESLPMDHLNGRL